MRSRKIKIRAGLAAVCIVAIAAAVWAGSARQVQAAGPVGSGTASATKAVCGMGTGKKATGTPIKLGGIDMLIPGVDFTTVGKLVAAYFDCVNDNGGIQGHPIQYILYNEQLNPTQEAALARKLIESDKVVGVVGNTSFAECGTNWRYYKSKGFVVIGGGVQAECFGTPSFAEVNMGPRYSNVGAAQALIAAGAKSIAIASPSTISAYADSGVAALGAKDGIPVHIFPTQLPVTDANSTILKLVQAAGKGGAVILDFTPDTAPSLLNAAVAQGLVNDVMWGSSTPIANTQMAQQEKAFDGKMFINSELALLTSKGPDETLYNQINAKYTPKIAIQSFGQFGYLDAKFATAALLSIKGPITAKSYNLAVRNLKDQKTDMLCRPWYVGNALPYHIPNNVDITVDYKNGEVVQKQGCFQIAAVDPQITQTRIWEKKYHLQG
jgi:branched-chain amino acid transport system substrate-binding protein